MRYCRWLRIVNCELRIANCELRNEPVMDPFAFAFAFAGWQCGCRAQRSNGSRCTNGSTRQTHHLRAHQTGPRWVPVVQSWSGSLIHLFFTPPSFFTPFLPEVPYRYHILLYVVAVGHYTKGVVELTYKWCHGTLPLLSCNEFSFWWTVTPRVLLLCPLLLLQTWAWPRASVPQVGFGELVYGMYTRGEPMSVQ